MAKFKIVNKIISESVNSRLMEIGGEIALVWGANCISYEIDYNEKEIFFYCIGPGEDFYTSVSFDELKKEYDIEVVLNTPVIKKIPDFITHKNIFQTAINSIIKEGNFPKNIDYCLVSDRDSMLTTELKPLYFEKEYTDLMFKLNYGGSEGIYLEVYVLDTKPHSLATIKTLCESDDGIFNMSKLQAHIIIKYNEILREIRKEL